MKSEKQEKRKLTMLKIFLTLLILSFTSCDTLPPLPEELRLYAGISETSEICLSEFECVKAESIEFDDYICLHRDQVEMLFIWIEEVNRQCK